MTEPIFDNNSNEQDGNEETARSELNNIFWWATNEKSEWGIVGEHLKNPFPENVMEIENDSDAKESEIMEINNNDENDDDSKNNR